MESIPGDFPGFRRLRADTNSSGLKGPEILFSSGVRTFHILDSFLLISLVDSWFSVLCAPFFWSSEAMEFAESKHRWEERPDLPVSLLMVLHTFGWSPNIQWNWQFFPIAHASCVRIAKAGTKRLYQSQCPLGLQRSNGEISRSFPSMAGSSCDGHVR